MSRRADPRMTEREKAALQLRDAFRDDERLPCNRWLHAADNKRLHQNRKVQSFLQPKGGLHPGVAIRGQPWVVLHLWVAFRGQPWVVLHPGGAIQRNPGLLCIRRLQFKDKNDQVNNTDISRTKRRICARRFPKGERKALWWGDGAKPHILKCCIHRLQFEDNPGLYCIRGLHSEHNRGLLCIHRLQFEDNPGLLCIHRLQFEDNPGLYCIHRL